ncbi:transaldolase [Striga asiatica]|uniref:Transaldolase n=1 Tax=Striga asiatica TaxID=4170 RepID=A0A5A7QWU1_STRAF|nr:transaldolase [Striga asiatica]
MHGDFQHTVVVAALYMDIESNSVIKEKRLVHGGGVQRDLGFSSSSKRAHSEFRNEYGRSLTRCHIALIARAWWLLLYCDVFFLHLVSSVVGILLAADPSVVNSCNKEGCGPLQSACGCPHNFHKKQPDDEHPGRHPKCSCANNSDRRHRQNLSSKQPNLRHHFAPPLYFYCSVIVIFVSLFYVDELRTVRLLILHQQICSPLSVATSILREILHELSEHEKKKMELMMLRRKKATKLTAYLSRSRCCQLWLITTDNAQAVWSNLYCLLSLQCYKTPIYVGGRYVKEGQSPWYDNLCRPLTDLIPLIESGVRGVTSNPVIFQEAISTSSAYNDQLSCGNKNINAKLILILSVGGMDFDGSYVSNTSEWEAAVVRWRCKKCRLQLPVGFATEELKSSLHRGSGGDR